MEHTWSKGGRIARRLRGWVAWRVVRFVLTGSVVAGCAAPTAEPAPERTDSAVVADDADGGRATVVITVVDEPDPAPDAGADADHRPRIVYPDGGWEGAGS